MSAGAAGTVKSLAGDRGQAARPSGETAMPQGSVADMVAAGEATAWTCRPI
jgi:hypothetical protein